MENVRTIFGDRKLQVSPPVRSPKANRYLRALTHFINCHGGHDDILFYGQRSGDDWFPTAISNEDVLKHAVYGTVVPLNPGAFEADAVFLALPEAASAELAPSLLTRGLRVIDLSGAFRLRDSASRAKFYPATGSLPDGVAYGLTEFEIDAIKKARLLSNPGKTDSFPPKCKLPVQMDQSSP